MKKLVLFLVLLCASCAPAQPAAIPTEVLITPPTAVAEVISVVDEPEAQEVPVTWEYKTLIMNARVSGPAGEKLTVEDCTDAADAPGAGSLCMAEDANTAVLEKLNVLGAERWELVAIVYAPDADSAVYFFKRPILVP